MTVMNNLKSDVSFVNSIDQQPITIRLNYKWYDDNEIRLANGHMIACIKQDLSSGRFIAGGARTYQLTVASGMDMSVCVAMCVIMDDRYKNRD